MKTKNITLRLPPDDYVLVESVAEVQGETVSAVIRSAIDELLTGVTADPSFRQHLESNHARKIQLLTTHAAKKSVP